MSDWSFSDLVDAGKNLGKSAAEVYNAWKGDDSDSETAYMKGQIAGYQAAQSQQSAADTITIGDTSISTSSLMWVIGGTLGLLAIGLGIKKFLG